MISGKNPYLRPIAGDDSGSYFNRKFYLFSSINPLKEIKNDAVIDKDMIIYFSLNIYEKINNCL